jgi:hypothetical protein
MAQLMIDTANETPFTIRAAIVFLTALLPAEETKTPAATDINEEPPRAGVLTSAEVVELFQKREAPPAPKGAIIVPPVDTSRDFAAANLDSKEAPEPPPPPLPPELMLNIFDRSAAMKEARPTPLEAPPPPPQLKLEAPNPPSLSNRSATSTTSSEIDSAGMPWDSRIHMAKRQQMKNGTWKIQKGCDPALVQSVTAELALKKAAVRGLPPPPPPPPTMLESSQSVLLKVLAQNGGDLTQKPAPELPPALPSVKSNPPSAPSLVETNGAASELKFRDLLDKVTGATRAQLVTATQIQQVAQQHGAPSFMALSQMRHLWADVNSAVDALLAGLG